MSDPVMFCGRCAETDIERKTTLMGRRRTPSPLPSQCRQRIGIWIDFASMHFPNSDMTPTDFRHAILSGSREIERHIDTKLYLERIRDNALIEIIFHTHGSIATANKNDGTCRTGKMRQAFHLYAHWHPQMTYVVFLHELGHNFGLDHIPGENVMNAGLKSHLPGYSTADVQAFLDLGYDPWINVE